MSDKVLRAEEIDSQARLSVVAVSCFFLLWLFFFEYLFFIFIFSAGVSATFCVYVLISGYRTLVYKKRGSGCNWQFRRLSNKSFLRIAGWRSLFFFLCFFCIFLSLANRCRWRMTTLTLQRVARKKEKYRKREGKKWNPLFFSLQVCEMPRRCTGQAKRQQRRRQAAEIRRKEERDFQVGARTDDIGGKLQGQSSDTHFEKEFKKKSPRKTCVRGKV